MRAVTIATKGYPLVENAVALMKKYTGWDTTVLTEDDNQRWNSGGYLDLLRLSIPEVFPGEPILYYDADYWIQAPLDESLIRPGLNWVRDIGAWNAKSTIHKVCQEFKLNARNFANAGFFIIDGTMREVFARMRQLVESRMIPWPDQIVMNIVAQTDSVSTSFLPLSYNCLMIDPAFYKRYPIVGAHMAGTHPPKAARALSLPTPHSIQPDLREVAGVYEYDRIGLGSRKLHLISDGTIGYGQDRLEIAWNIVEGGIVIYHKEGVTLTTERVGDTEYKGAWEIYEKSEVVLRKVAK